ncbi:MAG: SsrA-binding protein SmpB [Coriobacteriales bacterium]|nr:SsrA-binding protein SmpB [Coriobacteriales bacterium]
MPQPNSARREPKSIARNRKAYHDYFIDETIEAGIELTGTEVCSLRENNCQLTDCYVLIRRGEAWLHGVHIAPYSHGNIFNVNPDRPRRLLMHKREIQKLFAKVRERGVALIPVAMYFDANNRVKVEVGVGRGKKLYDKRASMAERDSKRAVERALKERSRG